MRSSRSDFANGIWVQPKWRVFRGSRDLRYLGTDATIRGCVKTGVRCRVKDEGTLIWALKSVMRYRTLRMGAMRG